LLFFWRNNLFLEESNKQLSPIIFRVRMKKTMLVLLLAGIIIVASIVGFVNLAFFGGSNRQKTLSSSSVISALAPAPNETTTASSPTNLIQDTNGTRIQLSHWQPLSGVTGSIVIIDSPTNNSVYSTNSVTLSVHAGI